MRKGKRTTSRSRSRTVTVTRKSSSRKNPFAKRQQAALKKAALIKHRLQRKLTAKVAEMKRKLKKAEADALKKAHSLIEREHHKREAARKRAVDSAVAKFEKHYAKIQSKRKGRTTSSRRKAVSRSHRSASVRSSSSRRGRPKAK